MTTKSPDAEPASDLTPPPEQWGIIKSDPKAAGQFGAILGIRPTTIKEAMDLAKVLSDSELVPKDFRGKPGNVIIAWEMLSALGIPVAVGIQNIAVINGRACIWGDLATAIVRSSPLTEYLIMPDLAEVKKTGTAWTRHKRKDQAFEVTYSFSKEDAEKAKLWGKEGPWTNYPYWMLQMRANAFTFKLSASDILKGMAIVEETRDIINLAKTAGGEFGMPKRASETTAAAPAAAPTPAATDGGDKDGELEQVTPARGEGEIETTTFRPEGVGKTEIDGAPTFVVRDPEKAKFYTREEAVARLVADAAKANRSVKLEYFKASGKNWIETAVVV